MAIWDTQYILQQIAITKYISRMQKDTDDAMQQALVKYDNGELESYEDEFESAFAESEDD